MKFDFENLKSNAEKIVIATGIIAAPSISSGEDIKVVNQINENTQKEITYNPKLNTNDKENIHYTAAIKESLDKENQENKEIIENIKKLENEFNSLGKEKPMIKYGSFSLISNEKLKEYSNKNDNSIKSQLNSEINVLSDKYVTEICEVDLFNKNDKLKILNKNFDAIKGEWKLAKEGYVKKKDFKHYIPEYYFIIDKNQSNNSSITYKIKIISTVNQEIINNIEVNDKLPISDIQGIEEAIDEKVIPEIVKIIEEKIVELNLTH